MKMLTKLFEQKPFNQGYLPEVDGHAVYFMEFGNPKGLPILFFHGGPGGRCKAKHTSGFDLKKYRLIMFDQRGSGNSRPKGQWEKNTPMYTISDAERLLDYLGIAINDKVILRGGSYGSTLSLLFAIKNPERVSKMLLSQIFLARLEDRKWIEEGSSKFYLDILDDINKPAMGNVADYYATLINSVERKKQEEALSYFDSYEYLLGQLNPTLNHVVATEDNVASARISINYFANDFYLTDDYILKHIKKIAEIPTLIVHNRLDFVCPPDGALKLKKELNNVDFVMVADSGHVSKKLYVTLAKKIKEFLI